MKTIYYETVPKEKTIFYMFINLMGNIIQERYK